MIIIIIITPVAAIIPPLCVPYGISIILPNKNNIAINTVIKLIKNPSLFLFVFIFKNLREKEVRTTSFSFNNYYTAEPT